MIYLCINTSHF